MHKRRFRLDLRKNFFMERLVKHWKGLPREMVQASFLEALKRHMDVARRDVT